MSEHTRGFGTPASVVCLWQSNTGKNSRTSVSLSKFRQGTWPRDLAPESLLIAWLCNIAVGPTGRWMFVQVVHRLAEHLESCWSSSASDLGALCANLADFGHRQDPAVRHAICRAARAKLAGSRLGKRQRKHRARPIKPNRNHVQCGMNAYFEEFRHWFADAVQICLAPDDSRFHGKNYSCSPVMDLMMGMFGWTPPKVIVRTLINVRSQCSDRTF